MHTAHAHGPAGSCPVSFYSKGIKMAGAELGRQSVFLKTSVVRPRMPKCGKSLGSSALAGDLKLEIRPEDRSWSSLTMKRQWNQTSERILDLTLEIIYLLTGQEYVLIKKPCDDAVHGRDLYLVDGSCRTQNSSMEPPLHSLTHEEISEKKILELTNKIIQLLTGEVPVRCEDVAIYFSMEEWEYIEQHKELCDEMMETYQPLRLWGDMEIRTSDWFPISVSSDCKSTSQNGIKNPMVDHLLVNEPQKRPFIGIKRDLSERGPTHINEKSTSCSIDVYKPATERILAHNEPSDSLGDSEEATGEWFPISVPSESRNTSQNDIRNLKVDYFINEPKKRPFECTGNSERGPTRVNEKTTSCSLDVYTPATEHISAHNESPGSLGDMKKANSEWFPISLPSECRNTKCHQSEIKNPMVDYPLVNESQKRPFECIGNKRDHLERGITHIKKSTSYSIDVYTPATERMPAYNEPPDSLDMEKRTHEWFPISVSLECINSSQSDIGNPMADFPLVSRPQKRPFECTGYKGDHSERGITCVNEKSISCSLDVYTPATEHIPSNNESLGSLGEMTKGASEWFPISLSSEYRKTSQSDLNNCRVDFPLANRAQMRPFECIGNKGGHSGHGITHVNEEATSCGIDVYTPATERISAPNEHEPVLCEIKNHLICSPREHSQADDMCIRIVDVKSGATSTGTNVHTHTEHAPVEYSFHQDSENRFSCFDCGEGFTETKRLVEHRKIHSEDKPYSCFECVERFTDKPSLFRHQLGHTKEKGYTCPECNRTFLYESRFSRHQKVHLTKTPLKATDCINCYTHHMRLARRKPFSCFECEERFTESSALIRHQFIHVKQKEYPCPECGKIFPYEARLVTHVRVHVRKKKYVCSECGKCFTQGAALLHHQWSHTGVKPFQCACGKVFATQASLIFHQKIHSGEKPHEV